MRLQRATSWDDDMGKMGKLLAWLNLKVSNTMHISTSKLTKTLMICSVFKLCTKWDNTRDFILGLFYSWVLLFLTKDSFLLHIRMENSDKSALCGFYWVSVQWNALKRLNISAQLIQNGGQWLLNPAELASKSRWDFHGGALLVLSIKKKEEKKIVP